MAHSRNEAIGVFTRTLMCTLNFNQKEKTSNKRTNQRKKKIDRATKSKRNRLPGSRDCDSGQKSTTDTTFPNIEND